MAKIMDSITTREVLSKITDTACQDLLMIETLIRTGMRTEELVSLKPEQIDDKRGTIEVKACKGSRNHAVPVEPEFARKLLGYLRLNGKVMGHRSSQGSMESVKRLTRRLFDEHKVSLGLAGQGYSLHSLRGGFAMMVYAQTRDIRLVQQLLGHKNINSTMSYIAKADLEEYRDVILKAVG